MKTGKCLCGAVTFTADEVKPDIIACHCRMCQRVSGGIFVTAPAWQLKFDGEEHIRKYRSSEWAERAFCDECGTHLYYRVLDSDEYDVCVGVFDDQSEFVLSSELFIDRKPDAYALAGDHPRLTEAETLEKYKVFDS